MRNSTIATSRTRATADAPLIDYRPLPAAWGDVDALHARRRANARAAERGTEYRILELRTLAESAGTEDARLDESAGLAARPGLFARLFGGDTTAARADQGTHRGARVPRGRHHHGGRHHGGHRLAAA